MSQIFVINNNDFDHFDSYDGTDYHFPPGEMQLWGITYLTPTKEI